MARKELSYSVKFKLTVVEKCLKSGLSRRDVCEEINEWEGEEEVVVEDNILNNNIIDWTDY